MKVWTQPYHGVRAFLLVRGVYLMVALDAWLLMIEHGGRYGVGHFNVAHFELLDRLLPRPNARLYVGLISVVGLLALASALFQVSRRVKLALMLVYTLAWSISIHDSYQHHYFLSWLLLYLPFVPTLTAPQLMEGAEPRRTGPAMPLIAFTCANLYVFTALSKLSPEWRSGAVLQALAGDREASAFSWLPRALMLSGVNRELAWQLAAHSLVVLQCVVALGYLASVARDASRSRWPAVLCSLALASALLFHVMAELDGSFAIGWFSYYMLWLATVLLLPASWLLRACRPLLRSSEALHSLLLAHPPSQLLATCTAGLLTIVTAQRADLPGVAAACSAVFVVFAADAGLQRLRGNLDNALRSTTAVAVCMASLLVVLELSSVRFDYYRRAAGERLRMGDRREALMLYRKAEQHAPRGRTRMSKIDQLQRELSQGERERF